MNSVGVTMQAMAGTQFLIGMTSSLIGIGSISSLIEIRENMKIYIQGRRNSIISGEAAKKNITIIFFFAKREGGNILLFTIFYCIFMH